MVSRRLDTQFSKSIGLGLDLGLELLSLESKPAVISLSLRYLGLAWMGRAKRFITGGIFSG